MIAAKAEVLTLLGKTDSITADDSALLDMVMPLADSEIKGFLQQVVEFGQQTELLPIGQPDLQIDGELDSFEKVGDRFVYNSGAQGLSVMQLKHLPVWNTGIEVYEDVGSNAGQSSGAFAAATLLTSGIDYWLDIDDSTETAVSGGTTYTGVSRTGLLHRYGSWPVEPRSVKVVYYGGVTASQLNGSFAGDIKQSAIETAAMYYNRAKATQGGGRKASDMVSESIGKYSYSRPGGNVTAIYGFGQSQFDLPYTAINRLWRHRNMGRNLGN